MALEEYTMTIFRTISCLILLVSLGGANAWAHKPGPDIIRECPKCKTHLEQHTMMSGNTFGARFWTDGKMVAPMLPDRPWLVKCPKCYHVFWINDAKKLGTQYRWDKDKKWPKTVQPALPTEEDYLNAVRDDNLSDKKELYARRRAWWLANDTIRKNTNATVIFSQAQANNLQKLAALLDERDPNQRLMKAELFRELGQFDQCIKLLSSPFKRERHAYVAAFIRQLAEQKVQAVREIRKKEKPKKKAIDSDNK